MQLHQNSQSPPATTGHQNDDRPARGHMLALTCLCIDAKSQYTYTGSKDGSIVKWCLEGKKILGKIKSISKKDYDQLDESNQKKHHTKHINCLAISSDNKFLASGGFDKHIRIWNPQDLTWIHTFTMHKQAITCLAFRQGHPMLYSGSQDRSVMLWTLEDDDNRCFVESLYGHESTVTSMDVLRRERVLTSGGRDQTIRIWKIVEQAQTVFETCHGSADITRLIDDQTFVSGGEDGTICVWTTMKRTPVVSIKNAHKPDVTIQEGLSYWISALATYSFKNVGISSKVVKKRKVTEEEGEDVLVAKYGDDDEEEEEEDEVDDEDEINQDEEAPGEVIQKNGDQLDDGSGVDGVIQETSKNVVALVASGSCDSVIRVWQLVKNGSKYDLKLSQSIACRGFINDLRFTNDGSKLVAACGQEHRLGRWMKLKGCKNTLRIYDVNKCR